MAWPGEEELILIGNVRHQMCARPSCVLSKINWFNCIYSDSIVIVK